MKSSKTTRRRIVDIVPSWGVKPDRWHLAYQIIARRACLVQYDEHTKEECVGLPLTLEMTVEKLFRRFGRYSIIRLLITRTDMTLSEQTTQTIPRYTSCSLRTAMYGSGRRTNRETRCTSRPFSGTFREGVM
jgi:hypothetical protein